MPTSKGFKIDYEKRFGEVGDVHSGAGRGESAASKIFEAQLAEHKAEWKREAATHIEEIKAEAFNEGFESGKAEAENKFRIEFDAIQTSIQQLHTEFNSLQEHLKPYITAMVFDLSEKIVSIPIRSDVLEKKVLEEVEDALSKLDEVKINLSISDKSSGFLKEGLAKIVSKRNILISETSDLNPGEYRIDTPLDQILKKFSKMLRHIRESVTFDEVEQLNGEK